MITKSGIYCICNLVNGKIYIGQTADFKRRCRDHIKGFNTGSKHSNPHLLAAWRKYGPEAFVFEVIEYVPKDKELLKEREQYWMDYLNVVDPETGYNISPTAGSPLGVKRTEEFRWKKSVDTMGEKNPMYGRTGEKNPSYQHAKCWEYEGKSQPLSDWAWEYGINQATLDNRVNKLGWSLERALLIPMATDKKGENSPKYKHAKCYDYDGKSQPLSAWAKEYGINKTTLNSRVNESGWLVERALTTPIVDHKKVECFGKVHTMSDWAKEYGISAVVLNYRVNISGWSIERALTTPIKRKKK